MANEQHSNIHYGDPGAGPTPFFSIIMPTYNRAAMLGTAIKSVLNQSFKSWELIVIDDGSTDNTKAVVAAFDDARIKYHYQHNAERSTARNNGIALARGRYICFLDSDDYYFSDHLQRIYAHVEAAGFAKALFITDVVRNENGNERSVPHESLQNHVNNVCFILMAAESVIPARVCIHADILTGRLFNPILKVSEDAELFTRIGAEFPFIQVPFHTVAYRLHDSNTTHRANDPFRLQLLALKIIFANKQVKKFIPDNIMRKKLSSCYYGIAQHLYYKKHYLKMDWYLLKSILLNPFNPHSKSKLYLIIKHIPNALTGAGRS